MPTNIRMLAELNKQLEEVPGVVEIFNLKIGETFEMYDILDKELFQFSKDDIYEKWEMLGLNKEIWKVRNLKLLELDSKKKIFIDSLLQEQTDFKAEINSVGDNIEKLYILQDSRKFKE